MSRPIILKFLGMLLFFEMLWGLNLLSGLVCPQINAVSIPCDYYEATPIIEVGELSGVAYLEEEAAERLADTLHPSLELALLAMIACFAAFIVTKRSKHQDRETTLLVTRRISTGLCGTSIALFVFSIIVLHL